MPFLLPNKQRQSTEGMCCYYSSENITGKPQTVHLSLTAWKKIFAAYTAQKHHHKANVSLKNLRTVVLTDVEDVISV